MEFPAFCFGGEEAVIERAEAEGARWVAAWRASRALPADALREIRAGELVIVHHGTLDPFTARWRLFGVGFALGAVMHELAPAEREELGAFVRATPWGALAECERLRPPNTVETVTARARALLAQWDALATLRYIGAPTTRPAIITFPALNQDPIGLDVLVGELFAGPLALWGPQLGPVRVRLALALDAMAATPPADAHARIVARMVELARGNRRTKDTAATDPSAVEAWLARLSRDERAALVPGVTSDLLSELYALARDDARQN